MPRFNIKHALGAGVSVIALAASLVIPHEGNRNEAYLDPVGVPTICRGHTGPEVVLGQTATEDECDSLLYKDLRHANRTVKRLVTVQISKEVEAALTDFTYNVGSGNFSRSTLLKRLNAGRIREACEQLDRWVYAGGRDCRIRSNNCYGIVKRRAEEKAMCLSGVR